MASGSIGQNKPWEPHITTFTQIYHSKFHIRTIIDIGANFGYHTVFFSHFCDKVYAFEPQLQNLQLLYSNVQLNSISNVHIHPVACGDSDCQIKMPLFHSDFLINMGDVTPDVIHDSKFHVTRSVVLDQLSFTSNIDLIKLDVQGWEKKVLLGAIRLLATHKPILIVEFEETQLQKTATTCKELFDFIQKQNYYIYFLDYEYPSDHICVHMDHLEQFRHAFQAYIFPHKEMNEVNDNVSHGIHYKVKIPF